jgi:3-dehydroquinate synthase
MMQTNRAIGHGIAVAVGLIAELHLSQSIFIQPDDEWSEVIQFITARFQQFCPVLTEDDIHAVCDLLIFDKKNANGKTLFVLLNGIGNPEYDVPCSETDVQNALEFYNVQIRL